MTFTIYRQHDWHTLQHSRRSHHSWRSRRAPWIERLEDRTLLSVNPIGIPKWVEQGPRPIINTKENVPPNNDATGAVESIAINPHKPSEIYVGSVNGGVWRTNKADPSNPDAPEWTPPEWTALTDQLPSLSMGDIAFSPLDPSWKTLFAGTGSFSSFGREGGPAIGVVRTTDGGDTWKVFPLNPSGPEPRVKTILPTSIDLDAGPGIREVVLVGTVGRGGGLYRSDDNGESYTLLSGANGLPSGDISQLIVDPNNSQRFYAGVPNQGIFQGDYDPVASKIKWTPVNTGIKPDSISTAGNIQIAAGDSSGNTVLFALLSGSNRGAFRSTNGGATWTTLATPPAPFDNDDTMGSGNTIVVDPTNDKVAYIATYGSGDTIFRYNPAGPGSWDVIDNGGAKGGTAPHEDFRDLAFQGSNVLVVSTDGGVYFIQNPLDSAQNAWHSYNGSGGTGLGTVEFHDIAWDSNSDIIFGGAQDNGTPSQTSRGSLVYRQLAPDDGGDVGVDNFTLAGMNQSIRYYSGFDLSGFRRWVWDAANRPVGDPVGIFPAGGLTNFVVQFVTPVAVNTAQYQNTIAPPAGQSTRIAIGGGFDNGTSVSTGAVYEANNAGVAPNADAVNWQPVPVTLPRLPRGVTGLQGVSAMAYGGVDNPDVLYVGYSSGWLLVRTSAGGNLKATDTKFPGSDIRGITLDPSDWQHAFVISSTGVWETPDAGATWNDDTGNLSNNELRTVQYIASGAASALLVGGLGGVFRMMKNEPGDWAEYGFGLPNAVTSELDYNEADNVLLAGTLGRGAWTVPSVRSTVFTPGVLQIEGDTEYPGEDDTIRLVRDPSNPIFLDVYINSTSSFATYQLSAIQQINVNGLGGNDTLIVDSSNGGIPVPIAYDGGAGSNALTLQGGTALTDTYAPGPNVGSGTSTLTFTGGVTETIQFQNLAPVLDTVSSPLTVTGTAANDVINYGVGSVPTNGLVTVNNFESIEFSNKTALTLNAGAGDDTITINNPNTPTSLTAIMADGGPGIDSLMVNALGNAVDVATAGTIQVTSQLPVKYGSIERIQILNAPDEPLTAVPASIQGTEGAPLTNVVVGGFSDGPNTPGTPKGKASDFTATIDWGDGTAGSPNITAGQVVDLGNGNFQVLGSHAYATAKTYPLTVTITDNGSNGTTVVGGVPILIQDLGGQSIPIRSQAVIVQAPLVAMAQPIFGVEGNAIPAATFLATFIDNGGAEAEGDYSATVDFGQGPIPANVSLVPGSTTNFQVVTATPYTFNQPGTYSVRVVITNNSGPGATSTAAQTTTTATITAAPLTLVLPVPVISTTERVPFTGPVAAFTSANPAAQPGQFTATIDWGDSTPTSAGLITQPDGPGTPFVVVGSHTYADSGVNGGVGTFPLTINVVASTGASVNIGNTASVADARIDLTGGLNPASDTGVSNSDAITSINQPNFTGKSEPNSTIQLFVQPTAGGAPQLVGQTTADASGSWNITTNLLADGRYIIIITAAATDAAGHTKATMEIEPATHPLVIDTVGPKVTGLTFDRVHGRINLTFQDELTGMDRQSLLDAANYLLSKQQTRLPGTFVLTSITTAVMGSPSAPQTVVLTFNGGRQIRGGHYTFTILSGSGAIGIRDVAGNALDGQFYGSFPSGNGHPGSNFIALLDAIHRRIYAPKSAVGSATPVAPTPPTIIPVSNPRRVFVGVRSGLRLTGQRNRSASVRIHDAALAHISAKRLPH